MTWSLSATISDSTASNRWLNFFDNHLNGLTAWNVTAHPSANSTYRSLNYNFTDFHDSSSQAYYYWYGNSILYEDSTYTTTPGDTGTDATTAVGVYPSTNNPWKVWTSNQEAGSLIMTDGKKIIFFWAEPVSIFNPNKTSWDGSTDRDDAIIFPLMDPGTAQYGANHGQGGTSTTEYGVVPDVCRHHGASNTQSSVDLYYNTWGYVSSSTNQSFAPFTKISQNDIIVQVPGNGIGNVGSTSIWSNNQVTIFDGTNYYLRTNSDLSHAALLFDFGTSEPVF